MRKIVVLGSGFAGYHAARTLEDALLSRSRVKLTLISDQSSFVFSPLLYNVASDELDPGHITTPLDEAFDASTEVLVARVERIDLKRRVLQTDRGEVDFDYLILAPGTARDEQAFEGAERALTPDSVRRAVEIRDRLAGLFEFGDRSPWRFAVVGASTDGVEWCAELASAIEDVRARNPELARPVEVSLIEARDRVLADHSEEMSAIATRYLKHLGVRLHTGRRVLALSEEGLTLDDGSTINAAHVFHLAGRRGHAWVAESGLPVNQLGRLKVEPTLQVEGHRRVYAVGDAADLPGTSPRNAQVAMQAGRQAAQNLLADLVGRARRPFVYEDRGDFVTLGRANAALDLLGRAFEGRAAWLAYRLYFTALMPQAFQKALLLMDWIALRASRPDWEQRPAALESDALKTSPGDGSAT
ncbi:hypothetical protein FRC96_14215 [Lujinxingia vulgaris]|uniref:FAD/NAD(P)-binding domain-containing protein n=1 Tax=Lujinxingia vulgaris TaxID=2600176 RepID=A0A5C6X6J7_9DELT|nr:FAD-dependent oxidoreductase [Lujinxingia vulgaris]TXD34349.1 hypothetical protein FRC96_14215 [Lujinxingia vulgaris]